MFIGPLPTRTYFLPDSRGTIQQTLSSLTSFCVKGLQGALLCIVTAATPKKSVLRHHKTVKTAMYRAYT